MWRYGEFRRRANDTTECCIRATLGPRLFQALRQYGVTDSGLDPSPAYHLTEAKKAADTCVPRLGSQVLNRLFFKELL
ncbi:hypothetical protein GSbR_08110 [Geobacter sp. SVR]|nr:hypothetical protein GSVR_19000 [Geobacter sp. SVR]GCF84211.1 hypothetical protein GSbR_08110 [Geobacter sp. SVR]